MGATPDFIIAGAMKAGTTSLMRLLQRHPRVHIGFEKRVWRQGQRVIENDVELHFFDEFWSRGEQWYFSKFSSEHAVNGESTPSLLCLSATHSRIARVVPSVKLVVLLRNPVDRAYSHFNHFRQDYPRARLCDVSFAEPFERHVQREQELHFPDEKGLLRRGFYVDQLELLGDLFPRKQIHIALCERVKRDPAGEYGRICEFLGIDAGLLPTLAPSPEHVRSYECGIDWTIREELDDLYAPYNQRLSGLLDDELREWS